MSGVSPELQPVDEIEELVDFHVHRPLARRLARRLLPTPITPDQITLIGGIVGAAAGVSLWLGADRPPLRLLAALLLFTSVVLDCTDGAVARMRQQISRTGVILDGFIDAVVGLSVLLAVTYDAARRQPGAGIWVLGAVAIASSEAHCFLFDVAKERYVTSLGLPYAGSKLLLADHWTEMERARKERRWADALLLGMFARYARLVRALGGAGRAAAQAVPPPISRRAIRAWTYLGLGTHMACVYVAAALSTVWPPALFACLIVFATIMNVVMVLLLWSQRT
jgi:phosphatidylglycerophosphate synthase